MNIPGFTAEASVYKAAGTYATRRTGGRGVHDNTVTLQQSLTLGSYMVNPITPPWLCRLEYWLCRGFIPTCMSRCLANNLWRCALASDPQACEAAVWMRCSGTCTVACDAQYARCLSGQRGRL